MKRWIAGSLLAILAAGCGAEPDAETRARTKLENDDYRGAIRLYEQARASDPARYERLMAAAYAAWAETAVENELFASAIERYRRAVELAPGRYERELALALSERGRLALANQDCAAAASAYDEAARLDPQSESYLQAAQRCRRLSAGQSRSAGDTAYESGRFEDAVAQYEVAVRADSGSASAHCWLGHALYKLGRYDQASQAYGQAIDLAAADAELAEPDRASLVAQARRFRAIIHLLFLTGHDAQAIADLEVVIGHDPKVASAHYWLALLLLRSPERTKNAERAVAYAQKACELGGFQDPEHLAALAAAHALAGNWERSTQHVQQAIERAADADKPALREAAQAYQNRELPAFLR